MSTPKSTPKSKLRNCSLDLAARIPLLTRLISLPPKLIVSNKPFEEESVWNFRQKRFFPVRTGELLQRRYEVVGKLGFGGNSTIWLCKDLGYGTENAPYVVVKIGRQNSSQGLREADIYRIIKAIESEHPGAALIRDMLNSFSVQLSGSMYYGLVHPPLAMSLRDLRMSFPDQKIPSGMASGVFRHVLLALDFLHTTGIVHTDLQDGNIMFTLRSQKPLERFERDEHRRLSARKYIAKPFHYTVYESHTLKWKENFGTPILTDFSLARSGHTFLPDSNVQPRPYQAPEIMLEMGFDCKVDMWNLGCLIYNVLFNKLLFVEPGLWNPARHLRGMVSVLGFPPREFMLRAGRVKGLFGFDAHGCWMWGEIEGEDLEGKLKVVDAEEKMIVLDFLIRCFRWWPEDRASAAELLETTWIAPDDDERPGGLLNSRGFQRRHSLSTAAGQR